MTICTLYTNLSLGSRWSKPQPLSNTEGPLKVFLKLKPLSVVQRQRVLDPTLPRSVWFWMSSVGDTVDPLEARINAISLSHSSGVRYSMWWSSASFEKRKVFGNLSRTWSWDPLVWIDLVTRSSGWRPVVTWLLWAGSLKFKALQFILSWLLSFHGIWIDTGPTRFIVVDSRCLSAELPWDCFWP